MTAPRPIQCGECGSAMALRRSAHGPFYGCNNFPACRGTHGAHPDGRPLGTPADAAAKRARIEAHAAFDTLWRGPMAAMRRRDAYRWLASVMWEGVHIADMTADECAQVVRLVAHRNTAAHTEAP